VNRQERKLAAQYLDQLVPLQGASHRDVVDYAVTVPMRNAELRARLANGSTTRLIDSRQFLGWQGYGANPTLLFNCGDRQVIVATGDEQDLAQKTFITRDGGQLALHA